MPINLLGIHGGRLVPDAAVGVEGAEIPTSRKGGGNGVPRQRTAHRDPSTALPLASRRGGFALDERGVGSLDRKKPGPESVPASVGWLPG